MYLRLSSLLMTLPAIYTSGIWSLTTLLVREHQSTLALSGWRSPLLSSHHLSILFSSSWKSELAVICQSLPWRYDNTSPANLKVLQGPSIWLEAASSQLRSLSPSSAPRVQETVSLYIMPITSFCHFTFLYPQVSLMQTYNQMLSIGESFQWVIFYFLLFLLET